MDADKLAQNADRPAEVRQADKEFQARFNEVPNLRVPSTKGFRAEHLGVIDIILLPGQWTETSRDKQTGTSVATAFEQGDRVVSYLSSATPHPKLLALLDQAPHKLTTDEVDTICSSVRKSQILSAATLEIHGRKALRIESRDPAGDMEISLFVATGGLFPKRVEQLAFESRKQDPSLKSVFDAAIKTIVWNSDGEPAK